jgi:hypothetical protein
MNMLATVAAEMSAAFESRTRTNGESFRCLKDGSPEWMKDVAHEGHGDMLPDDWRYRMVEAAVDAISESDGNEDDSGEAADAFIPIYTVDRLNWLASHTSRLSYCDEAAADGICAKDAEMSDRIAAGIYVEFQEAYGAVLEALKGEAETREDEDEADDADLEDAAEGETCTACNRPSIDCSRNPCPEVIADRGND